MYKLLKVKLAKYMYLKDGFQIEGGFSIALFLSIDPTGNLTANQLNQLSLLS